MSGLSGVRPLLAAVVTACLLGVLIAAPAKAAVIQVTCTGTGEADFDPGLTFTEQVVSVSGQETAELCASLTHPNLDSFVAPFSGSTERSCLSLLEEGSGTQTFFWNGTTTRTSEWAWTSRPTQTGSALVIVATGRIVSGVLAGALVTQEQILAADTLAVCDQPGGLTHVEGPSTWQFTGL